MKPVKIIIETDGKRKVVIYQNDDKPEFTFVAFEFWEQHQIWRPFIRYLAYVETKKEAFKLAQESVFWLADKKKRKRKTKKRKEI